MAGLELILALLAVVAALQLVAERLAIPHPVLLVVVGGVLAMVPGLPRPHLDPDVVFLVFVPPLLYAAAITTSLRDFRRSLRPIVLNSVGLVLATMAAVAAVARALAPELTWPAAFVLGAIVSPPDPVAVVAVTRRLGVPRVVVTILEGEGLVNDATALVAYRMAVAAVVAGTFSLGAATLGFVLRGAGGVLVGLAVGYAVFRLRRRIGRAPIVENTVSLLTPFAAYIPADRIGASGVLAVVAVGLYLGRQGPWVISPPSRIQSQNVWSLVSFLLEGLVFILVGLELPVVLASIGGRVPRGLLLCAAAVSGAAILVRLLWVFPTAYLPRLLGRWLGRPEDLPSWRQVAFVGWAGLRGADSLVVALALPVAAAGGRPFPGRSAIIFLTFAVIFVTLVLQGLTLRPVIRLLGLRPDGEDEDEETRSRLLVAKAGLARLDELAAAGDPAPDVLAEVRERLLHRVHRLEARAHGGTHEADERFLAEYRRLRLAALAAERHEVVRLRDEEVISDDVMRRVQRDLDLEQILLESPEKPDAEEGEAEEEVEEEEQAGDAAPP
jgi:Na+/H+ antiporter